ncbi:MAG: FAD:protein FMN transferase [Flavobacteriales bacterium]|nr:FAD:protein FMN transferase [Flavobacteriales bacterium]
MQKNQKSKVYYYSLFILSFLLTACNNTPTEVKMQGYAQGTTYHITYIGHSVSLQTQLDSLLMAIDLSMSTYKPNSTISKFNQSDSGVVVDPLFAEVYKKSIVIYRQTNGLFDPTVAPLVNAWGFGKDTIAINDSLIIDSMLHWIGLDKTELKENLFLRKETPGIQLDFNAIAQGYSVDLIADYLEKNNITNYMVEIGGEIKTKGKNANGEDWKIGIDKPIENSNKRELSTVISLTDKAMATSGNYRKFYIKNGKKYSHTINPITGHPAENSLLSVTVVTNTCIDADAYATAFMVMGLEKTLAFLEKEKNIRVYIIYTTSGGEIAEFISDELKNTIQNK